MNEKELIEWIARELFDVWKEAKSTEQDNWDDTLWENLSDKHQGEYLKTASRIHSETKAICDRENAEAIQKLKDEIESQSKFIRGLTDKCEALKAAIQQARRETAEEIITSLEYWNIANKNNPAYTFENLVNSFKARYLSVEAKKEGE